MTVRMRSPVASGFQALDGTKYEDAEGVGCIEVDPRHHADAVRAGFAEVNHEGAKAARADPAPAPTKEARTAEPPKDAVKAGAADPAEGSEPPRPPAPPPRIERKPG